MMILKMEFDWLVECGGFVCVLFSFSLIDLMSFYSFSPPRRTPSASLSFALELCCFRCFPYLAPSPLPWARGEEAFSILSIFKDCEPLSPSRLASLALPLLV